MENLIIKTIRELGDSSFFSLYNEFKKQDSSLSKQDFGQKLVELSKSGILAEIDKKWYVLSDLEPKEGYIHWNMGSLCWVSDKDTTNNYGISFTTEDDLLLVFNKRKAICGGYAKGRIIPGEKRNLFFISECQQHKKIDLLVSYDVNSRNYVSLGGGSQKIKFDDSTVVGGDGEILRVKGFYENKIEGFDKFGLISDRGIEGKVVKEFCQIGETLGDIVVKENKLDYLDKFFFSIDAISTKDIDDAIAIEKTERGFELYVAIADVSNYIGKGDLIDNQAKEKTTTYYLFNETVHMLPRGVAEELCSLKVGQDRLAMICHLSYDKEGRLLSSEFLNNKINVGARLTYKDVDSLLAGGFPKESLVRVGNDVESAELCDLSGLKKNLLWLDELSDLLKKDPLPVNYWFLKSANIVLGDNGKVSHLDLSEEENGDKSQKMVEVSMLEANKAAAEFLASNYPYLGLYRNQVAPSEETERPKSAFYHDDNGGHWGLQTDFYTHFTSPIRRYCDLMVHRLIKDVIYNKPAEYTKEEVAEIGRNINLRQYMAKQCFTKEKGLLFSQYLSSLVGEKSLIHRAKIVDYSQTGVVLRNSQNIDVFLPNFKMDRALSDVVSKLPLDPAVEEKVKILNDLNENWKIKFFIDSFNWLDDKKEVTAKIYERGNENDKKKIPGLHG